MRSALNSGLGLNLKAPGFVRKSLSAQAEHQKVIANLPADMHKDHPAAINKFLYYLEQQSQTLPTLIPQDSNNKRPELLEKWVNQGIKDKQVPVVTRSAMNKLLNLNMLSELDSQKLLKRKQTNSSNNTGNDE